MAKWKVIIEVEVESDTPVYAIMTALADIAEWVERVAGFMEWDGSMPFRAHAEKIEEREGR